MGATTTQSETKAPGHIKCARGPHFGLGTPVMEYIQYSFFGVLTVT